MIETNNNQALHFIQLAKHVLSEKAIEKQGRYRHKKHVKLAGRIASLGVQTALDSLFVPIKKGRRMSDDWYQSALKAINGEATSHYIAANQILKIDLCQDGSKIVKIAELGINEAENLIHCINQKLKENKNTV